MFRWIRICLAVFVATCAWAESKWETLEDCKLLNNSANDGDSFHVQHHSHEYIFRLYYVDTPETEDEYPERVSEQAAYFKISRPQALRVGKAAARFTAEQLHHNFTVITRWDDARGNSKLPRHYAFVLVDGKDLGESLVEHGLARVFGEKAIPPDGRSTKTVVEKLQRLERRAKTDRLGAWARSSETSESEPHALPVMPLPNAPATNTTTQAEEQYRISKNGVRHNSKCRFFDSPNNKPCGPNDGRACQICGG